jgi:hypothetical protein
MSSEKFIDRVLARLPKQPVTDYFFTHWRHADRPTDEGFGLLPVPGAVPAKVLESVFDIDHYTGTIPHVTECRTIADERFEPPQKLRFYQRIKIPLLGEVHHELVLERLGQVQGFEIAVWTMLERETEALSTKGRIRSQINEGAWLAADGAVGYALSSAPRRDDVGFLKWKALTAGADALAVNVIRENIDGMSRWAARR